MNCRLGKSADRLTKRDDLGPRDTASRVTVHAPVSRPRDRLHHVAAQARERQVQPGTGLVRHDQEGQRRARPGAHLHVLRGTAEPHDPHVHAAVHPADQRVQQEAGEPDRRRVTALHVLQLRPAAHGPDQAVRRADHAGDGSRQGRSRLVTDRDRRPARFKRRLKLTHHQSVSLIPTGLVSAENADILSEHGAKFRNLVDYRVTRGVHSRFSP